MVEFQSGDDPGGCFTDDDAEALHKLEAGGTIISSDTWIQVNKDLGIYGLPQDEDGAEEDRTE